MYRCCSPFVTEHKYIHMHARAHVQVLLAFVTEHMGATLRVVVTEAAKFYVRAKVLQVLHVPRW